MARKRMAVSEAVLLSRADARTYCGCLGEQRFDREVGPHVTPKLIGSERFYLRQQLDAWAGVDGQKSDTHLYSADWIDKVMGE